MMGARTTIASMALLLASCAQATQIVIVVDSDLMLTRVDVQVSSTHSPPTHATAEFAMPGTPGLPLTLSVYPRASADIDVVVVVTGTRADGSTIERDVRTHFVAGSSRMLRVLLAARCLTLSCVGGQTCDETGCRDVLVPGDSLPAWTGSAPSLSGMAACTPVDERCNGLDDDCDMMADEGFHLASDAMNCGACGHACASGACTSGFCPGEQVTQLASGGAHACAVTMGGSVECWGWNDQRQLGQASGESNTRPTVVAGITGAMAVSAGALHTCAIDGTSRCECFGDGDAGELGRGMMTTDDSTPLSVAGTTSFTSVVAGVAATCAIDTMHRLFCWGDNSAGQLGNGTMSMVTMPPSTPVFSNASAVSMGLAHACAVRMDMSVWCWGDDGDGQLGPGMVVTPGAPIQVTGIADAIGVACGRAFTCVLHRGGTVDCFGANDQGQLGSGAMGGGSAPMRVMGLSDATSIAAAVAGTHACAVRQSGLIACWGGNASGQLGDGTTMMRRAPVMVAMPSDVAAVAPGGIADDGSGHTCALDHEGRVWCWGDAALGQLGSGDTMQRERPLLVLGAI